MRENEERQRRKPRSIPVQRNLSPTQVKRRSRAHRLVLGPGINIEIVGRFA